MNVYIWTVARVAECVIEHLNHQVISEIVLNTKKTVLNVNYYWYIYSWDAEYSAGTIQSMGLYQLCKVPNGK